MEKGEARERKYDLERLPSDSAQAAGADLVLAESVRRVLRRYAEYRLKYQRRGYALLLCSGPPGTGKSVTVRMAADEAVRLYGLNGLSGNLLIVRTPQLYSANLGETPKRFYELFADIKLSTSKRITAILFEDCEGLLLSREQTVANNDPSDLVRATEVLLKGLDELRFGDNLLIYATGNFSGVLDRAVTSRVLYVVSYALPTLEERRAILARQLGGRVSEETLDLLAAATEGSSGRDLVNLEFKAFVLGTGAPEELTAEAYLAAVGVTNGTGSGVKNGHGTSAANGNGNGHGALPPTDETAAVIAEEMVEEAAMVAATVTNGKEEVCQNGQKESSRNGYQQAPSPRPTKSKAPSSWFERLQRCSTWPPLPPG